MKTVTAEMNQTSGQALTVKLSIWWGYIFSAMYILYGGVSIILAVLDRQYADMGKPIIFLVLGGLLALVAMAFRDRKSWGWYGLVAINVAIVVLTLISLKHIESIVLLILAGIALVALFAPATKNYCLGSR